jgi:hypothetical protein
MVTVGPDLAPITESGRMIAALEAEMTFVTMKTAGGGWGHRSCLVVFPGDFVPPEPPDTGARGGPMPHSAPVPRSLCSLGARSQHKDSP